MLPFDNTSGDPADEYFSVGMTDELAHALSRVPGLRIAGRTSSYAFKGRNVPAQDIGRALDVGTIVSGAVRRSGDRLRMTVQLVGTADGKVLSDSVYESRSSDIFAVQDEFTRAIVAALAQALAVDVSAPQATGDVGRGTRDQEAYDLYLRGRYHTLERGTDNLTQAIALFRQAISRDPGFARAHAGLAQAYGILPAYVRNASDSSIALMTASAERAIALDSTLADAQLALGMALDQRLRFTAAIRHYRTAIALEPANQFAHHLLGFALVNIGHLEEAVSVLRRATQLDPLAKSAASSLAAALTDAGQYAEAESTARRVLGLDSTFPIALGVLGYAQVAGAHPDEAVPTLERNIRLHPGAPGQRALLLYAYASSGRWEEAERMRTEIRHSSTDGTGAVEAAVAELVFGNSEPLASLLTRTEGQAAWFETYAWFGCHRLLDPIRSDPRFVLAMRELGVASCGTARGWSLPPRT